MLSHPVNETKRSSPLSSAETWLNHLNSNPDAAARNISGCRNVPLLIATLLFEIENVADQEMAQYKESKRSLDQIKMSLFTPPEIISAKTELNDKLIQFPEEVNQVKAALHAIPANCFTVSQKKRLETFFSSYPNNKIMIPLFNRILLLGGTIAEIKSPSTGLASSMTPTTTTPPPRKNQLEGKLLDKLEGESGAALNEILQRLSNEALANFMAEAMSVLWAHEFKVTAVEPVQLIGNRMKLSWHKFQAVEYRVNHELIARELFKNGVNYESEFSDFFKEREGVTAIPKLKITDLSGLICALVALTTRGSDAPLICSGEGRRLCLSVEEERERLAALSKFFEDFIIKNQKVAFLLGLKDANSSLTKMTQNCLYEPKVLGLIFNAFCGEKGAQENAIPRASLT